MKTIILAGSWGICPLFMTAWINAELENESEI